MGVTFRDEPNELSSIIIGYSDTTVTAPNHPFWHAPNHPIIIRSKTLLATSHDTVP